MHRCSGFYGVLMFLDMQGQDAVYSWINQGKEPKMDRWDSWEDNGKPKMAKYGLTAEEFEAIQAIRKGEAVVVMIPKKNPNVKIGDIDQDDCEVISIDDYGYLMSSRREPEEIEAALKKGAKRVVLD